MVCNDLWSIKLMVLLEIKFHFQLENQKGKEGYFYRKDFFNLEILSVKNPQRKKKIKTIKIVNVPKQKEIKWWFYGFLKL